MRDDMTSKQFFVNIILDAIKDHTRWGKWKENDIYISLEFVADYFESVEKGEKFLKSLCGKLNFQCGRDVLFNSYFIKMTESPPEKCPRCEGEYFQYGQYIDTI